MPVTRTFFDQILTTYKWPVLCATTAEIDISSPADGIDGITTGTTPALITGTSRILVKDQSTLTQNGIYLWQGVSTPLVRAEDCDGMYGLEAGSLVYIVCGDLNKKKTFVCTSNTVYPLNTPGDNDIIFEEAKSTFYKERFVGADVDISSEYQLDRIPKNDDNFLLFKNGSLLLNPDHYTLTDDVITFGVAVVDGADELLAFYQT